MIAPLEAPYLTAIALSLFVYLATALVLEPVAARGARGPGTQA
jgi:hypothetical protein